MSCITLQTDFGLQDASVASVKGILMQYVPQLPIIDISHLTEPYHLQQAAYILTTAYSNFPLGTCHLVLFDFFSDKNVRLLLCEKDGYYFLAPDNGILSLALNSEVNQVWNCFELSEKYSFKDFVHEAAKIIQLLQTKKPAELGFPICELRNAPTNCKPIISENGVECQVIHIDRFENVVINITKKEFEAIGKGRNFRINFMRDEEINVISNHYSSNKDGEKLCRFNSNGYLEIAINRGMAASLFGLRLYREQHIMYNTIKIFFE
jgi:S-adenosylmethionine hydrolase